MNPAPPRNTADGLADAQTARRPGQLLPALVLSARPLEWSKNTFVFAALIFSGKFFSPEALTNSILAFVALCLAASGTYLLNDVRDREGDRAHPTKRNRPIASGILPVGVALAAAIAAGIGGIGLAFVVNLETGITVVGYLLLTTLYSVALKRVVILDVVAVAVGFVLRVIVGAEAIGVAFSSWLVLCTFMLALFLGFAKRRHEVVLLESSAQSHRPTLGEYSPQFLDMMMAIVTAGAVMSYVLYTMDPETIAHFGSRNMIYTSVFVLYGIFRYLYLIHQKSSGGNPAVLLSRDWSLLVSVVLWVITVFLLRYF
jgi:4-hydroxybenzoate polyprenyltransferase